MAPVVVSPLLVTGPEEPNPVAVITAAVMVPVLSADEVTAAELEMPAAVIEVDVRREVAVTSPTVTEPADERDDTVAAPELDRPDAPNTAAVALKVPDAVRC